MGEPSPASWAPEELRGWNGSYGWTTPSCLYCGNTLRCLGNEFSLRGISEKPAVHVCQRCGWWLVSRRTDDNRGSEGEIHLHRTWGLLRTLDISDVSAPIAEVQRYLLAKYSDRFTIHPRKYEELVASVFGGLGYKVRLTSFAGDDGVDIFVLDGDSDTIGVQVKRYRERIEAEQIRAFAGALVLNGLTRGIYVTTSGYRRGAEHATERYGKMGLAIDLWDPDSFYDRMQIVQRPPYESYDDHTAPFFPYAVEPSRIPRCWTHAW
jgi:restriction system protein